MKQSLKNLSRAAVLAAGFIVASCAPAGPESPENDLALEAKTFALSAANLSDTTDATLVCGCPYFLTVVSYTGDTSMIHYEIPTFAIANGQAVSRYRIIMKGETGAPFGNYTSQLILKGGGEGFLDTITTTYVVQ